MILQAGIFCGDVRVGAWNRGRKTSRGLCPPLMFAALTLCAAILGCDGAAQAQTMRRLTRRIHPDPLVTAAISGVPFVPRAWQPERGRECIRRGRLKGFCQGPRRVPAPYGEAGSRAAQLGMGGRARAVRLLLGAPPRRWVEAARELDSAPRWTYPVEGGRFIRGLGRSKVRRGGGPRGPRRRPHAGLDIGAPEGAPIRAVQNGIVVYSDNGLRGYGNLVMVVHPDGSVALYGHCRATYVFAGQRVVKGQIIGEIGQTGYALGPHLHFEYRVRGRPRDPSKLFER